MTIRSWMSSIMDLIRPELSELSAIQFENLPYLTLLTLQHLQVSNQYQTWRQSAPNLVKMYVIMRSQMSSIMDLIGPELSKLSALEFEKLAIFDFVYILASANIDQSVPNLATMYMPIRSQMSLIIRQIEQNIRSYWP